MAGARPSTASRSRRPIRSTSSTPRARPVSPRASCATTAATRSRCAGAWSTSTTSRPARCTGPPPTSAGWSATRYIVYAPLLNGCTTIVYEGKPVGTPDRRRLLAGDRAARRGLPVHRADRVPRDQEGGPDGELHRPATICPAFARCSSPASAAIRTRCAGREQKLQRAGDRSLVADRDRLADRRQLLGHRAAAGQARLADQGRCRATTCACWTRRATSKPRGEIGSIVVKLPLPPGTLPTLWHERRALRRSPICRATPATTRPATPATCDEDGYVYVMSRIDDVINVAGHRLSTGAMEEVLAAHPDVAECAVIGVADELKGQLPLGLVVLKAGVDRPEAELQRGAGPAGARADRSGRGVQAGAVVRACPRPAPARSCAAP